MGFVPLFHSKTAYQVVMCEQLVMSFPDHANVRQRVLRARARVHALCSADQFRASAPAETNWCPFVVEFFSNSHTHSPQRAQ